MLYYINRGDVTNLQFTKAITRNSEDGFLPFWGGL